MEADEELIGRLSDSDPLVRRNAARELGERRATAAVRPLMDLLASQEVPERLEAHAARAAAAVALGRIGRIEAVPALLEAMRDEFNVGTAASTALSRMQPPPLPELLEATRSQDRWSRARAVVALGEIREPDSFEAMARLLDDPEDIVQRAAATGLEKLGDTRAIGPLLDRLPAASSFVRTYVAAALGSLRSTEAIPALLAMLEVEDSNERRAAARALCRIDDPTTRDRLSVLAESDPDTTVRQVTSRYLNPRDGQRRH